MDGKITMAHGGGGQEASELMRELFGKYFNDPALKELGDAALISVPEFVPGPVEQMRLNAHGVYMRDSLAFTTDSFVAEPLEFPGGDIGKLAICGTVNDLLVTGAEPRFLSAAFILEEGLDLALLERIVTSMAKTAEEAGIRIVCGDTKVIEYRGASADGSTRVPGVMINTSGIGHSVFRYTLRASNIEPGDAIIVSGNLGDHHAAMLSARLGMDNGILSDCALLTEAVQALQKGDRLNRFKTAFNEASRVHAMRDITRGGLATVLNELSESSGLPFEIEETAVPVDSKVSGFCGILGLDPLYMGNEGKLVAFAAEDKAEEALADLRNTKIGKNAAIIGRVGEDSARRPDVEQQNEAGVKKNDRNGEKMWRGDVTIKTKIGGSRRLERLIGEGLPRIC